MPEYIKVVYYTSLVPKTGYFLTPLSFTTSKIYKILHFSLYYKCGSLCMLIFFPLTSFSGHFSAGLSSSVSFSHAAKEKDTWLTQSLGDMHLPPPPPSPSSNPDNLQGTGIDWVHCKYKNVNLTQ